MKNSTLTIVLTVLIFSCNPKKESNSLIKVTKINDLGTIKIGTKITRKINIANPSKINLSIKNIKASCGCTATNIKDSIIKAGGSTEFLVTFNTTKEYVGKFSKSIVIEANTKPTFTILYLQGEIIK